MTYSIVLRDPEKNHFGIAVATKHLAVGARVPFLEAGFGAIATQSTTNPYLGLKGLASLRSMKLSVPWLVTMIQNLGNFTDWINPEIFGLGLAQTLRIGLGT